MPASDTRQLQLQISASAELLIRNLKTADNAVAEFQRGTDARLASIDGRFAALGALKGKLASLDGSIGLGGLASAATGVTLIALAQRGLDYASSLGEVSQQLGVTTRDLQVYSYIASQVGIAQETMEKGLAKLTLTLGKARAGAEQPTKAFQTLGISIKDLDGKSTGDVVGVLADKLSRVKDPATRAALEIEFFGKAGQKLDTLLAGGRGQIDELTRAAQDLGLVLSDEQIQNADRTADKLSEVKQVLEANVAKVVADNAAAIYQLANALTAAAGSVANFLASEPDKAAALIGALAGGRVAGGPGIVVGAVAGAVTGARYKAAQADGNDDLRFRAKKLRDARATYNRDRTASADAGFQLGRFINIHFESTGTQTHLDTSRRELQKQLGLTQRAIKNNASRPKAKPTPTPVIDGEITPGQFLASPKKGATGKSAEQLHRDAEAEARKYRADQRRANDLLSRAQVDLAGARADASNDPEERLRIEQERIDLAKEGRDRDLEEQALDNKYIAASLDRLKSINAQAAAVDKQLLTQRRAQELDQSAYDRRRSEQDDAIALADLAGRLTLIARDRHEIERRILALRQREEREALQRVIDDKTGRFTPDDKKLAKDQLGRLPARQEAERKILAQDQQGPLGRYRDDLVRSTGDINEALEGVAVNGFQNLEDQFVGVINGTTTLKDAFKSMAASIIADLARIAIRKAIVAAIGGGFGFADGGSLGDVPGRASGGSLGGLIRGPGTGRSDSVLALLRGPDGGAVRLSNREFIMNERAVDYYGQDMMAAINARRLPRFADGGALGGRSLPSLSSPRVPTLRGVGARAQRVQVDANVKVEASPLLAATVEQTAVRTVGAAAEPIMAGAESRTIERLRRPSLPGAPG